MNIDFKKIIPHGIVLVLFAALALAYFYPVLQGKKIQQTDIVQYAGMAKKQTDYRKITGEELYWTDNAFGGMPTYVNGARYPHMYIKSLDRTLRFLPRPADYLFLYFLGMYVLLLVLKIDYKLAFLGSLAFGFSTYYIVILGVGHNAKAHAIAYFPLVLAGIILTFRKNYIWGFLLTALAMSLEIMTGHPQMTYYLLLLVLIFGAIHLVEAIKNKEQVAFFKIVGVLLVAVILAIGVNGMSLMATKQYADWSMRGKSELTINPDGSKKKTQGLTKDYITEYSYEKMESFNLLIPRFMGGAAYEDVGEDSKSFKFLLKNNVPRSRAKQIVSQLPTYWGDQPILAAPAYVGAVIIFFALLGLLLVRSRARWWLLGGIIMSLLLSWGRHFEFLTNFMIDYFPLYSKFRAVSSIQVILELCIPILGILGLARLFNKDVALEEKKKALYYSTGILAVLILFFIVFKEALFDFTGVNDDYFEKAFYGPEFMEIIREDRVAFLTNDSIRSLLLILASAGVLLAYLMNKLKENIVIVLLAGLILFDLVGVDRRYVATEGFVTKAQHDKPFATLKVDQQILKDKGHYRVYEPRLRMANSRTSYFHNAIGGYHAAKPRQFQELYDFHISENNVGVLNMLNVRYIINDLEGEQDERGAGAVALKNPYANGSAWFVEDIKTVATADEEMLALKDIDTKKEVIIRKDHKGASIKPSYVKDSLAKIELVKYFHSDHLQYQSENPNDGFAVFSEIHYPHGWNAYIDGTLVPHYRVNFVLRGLEIPAGKHTIDFKFEPEIVKTGIMVSLSSTILLMLLIIGGVYYEFRKRKQES